MRIVQVVQGFPPENLGGTETYAAQLSYELLHYGHEVHVFSRNNNPACAEYELDAIERNGLRITRVNNPFRRLSTFTPSYNNTEIPRRFGAFAVAVAS